MGTDQTSHSSSHSRPLCLALDFGGTKLAAGLVNWQNGLILRQARCATASHVGALGQVADMLALVNDQLRPSPQEASALWGVGVSFGGPVAVDTGTVLLSHHVEGWENLPLVAHLQEKMGLPVVMENDANAVCLGEYRYGAGKGVQDLVYLTVSTGIGGGVVIGGRLWRGNHGMAGEIGHMVVRPDSAPCTCGNRGCLESLAAGPAIVRRAREALAHAPAPSALLQIAGDDPAAITAEMVFRAARAGDAAAAQTIEEVATDLGLAIAMLCSVVDPARVILGGGVAKAGEQLLQPVRRAFAHYAFPMLVDQVSIVQAAALDEGGLLGAAALVAQAATSPS